MGNPASNEERVIGRPLRYLYQYYETDGDSGAYYMKLFLTREGAEKYWRLVRKSTAYGKIDEIPIYR